MSENNFDWISDVKPKTQTAINLIVFCKKQPPKWSPVTDAALRILLFGINGGLASKKESLPYFTLVNNKIASGIFTEEEIFMLAFDIRNSAYFFHNCNANVPLEPVHTDIFHKAYSEKYFVAKTNCS